LASWGFLLGEPFDAARHTEGRLQVYRSSPAELLEAYLPAMTLAQRRRALAFEAAVARGERSYHGNA
jgi:hypothetical protein